MGQRIPDSSNIEIRFHWLTGNRVVDKNSQTEISSKQFLQDIQEKLSSANKVEKESIFGRLFQVIAKENSAYQNQSKIMQLFHGRTAGYANFLRAQIKENPALAGKSFLFLDDSAKSSLPRDIYVECVQHMPLMESQEMADRTVDFLYRAKEYVRNVPDQTLQSILEQASKNPASIKKRMGVIAAALPKQLQQMQFNVIQSLLRELTAEKSLVQEKELIENAFSILRVQFQHSRLDDKIEKSDVEAFIKAAFAEEPILGMPSSREKIIQILQESHDEFLEFLWEHFHDEFSTWLDRALGETKNDQILLSFLKFAKKEQIQKLFNRNPLFPPILNKEIQRGMTPELRHIASSLTPEQIAQLDQESKDLIQQTHS